MMRGGNEILFEEEEEEKQNKNISIAIFKIITT